MPNNEANRKPPVPSAVIDLVDGDNDSKNDVSGCGGEPVVIDLVIEAEQQVSKKKQKKCRYNVVLLVDDREPIEFLNRLHEAGVVFERRRLATFDFLWIAKKAGENTEYVLGHGAERKQIHDLFHSLNAKNKTTDLSIHVYQKLKMNNSGVERKFYIVQGKIKEMDRNMFRVDRSMRLRVYQNIKEMEKDGFDVRTFGLNDTAQIVDFLLKQHRRLESQAASSSRFDPVASNYLTFEAMTERADWVTKVAATRKSMSKCSLGEKKLQLVFMAFPTEQSFQARFQNLGTAAMVEHLVSLNPDRRKGLSKATAQTLCSSLCGPSVQATQSQGVGGAGLSLDSSPGAVGSASVVVVSPEAENSIIAPARLTTISVARRNLFSDCDDS